MSTDCPELSDDELLAAIYMLDDQASCAGLCGALARDLGAEVGRDYVDERLHRLRAAGLVSFIPSVSATAPRPDVRSVRLTARGVERLSALNREPVAPRTS
jgi:hypothetical protein